MSRIVKLTLGVRTPYVLSISGAFGSGKTWLLTRLVQNFEDQGHQALYINLFDFDRTEDPSAVLLSHIIEWSRAMSGVMNVPLASKALQSKSEMLQIIQKYIKEPALLLDAISGLLPENSQGGSAALVSFIASIARKGVEWKKERKSELDLSLSEILDIALSHAAETASRDEPQKRVVLLLDELDRCRPEFALKTLHAIRHLFNIPGVVFIIGVERDHLASSLTQIVGPSHDMDGYIRKFVDLDCELPANIDNLFISAHFIQEFGAAMEQFKLDGHLMSDLMNVLNFSPREAQRYISQLRAACLIAAAFDEFEPNLFCYVTLVSWRDPAHLDNVQRNQVLPESLPQRILKLRSFATPSWTIVNEIESAIRQYYSGKGSSNFMPTGPFMECIHKYNGLGPFLKAVRNTFSLSAEFR